MDFEYRGHSYSIQWVEGLAHYTINYGGTYEVKGIGNHGLVKDLLDDLIEGRLLLLDQLGVEDSYTR